MSKEFLQIGRSGNLSDAVASEIKDAIINGSYLSGDALPSEIHLTEQFGVSRIVIREALKELKSKGLIEIRRGPKGGPYVTQFSALNFGEQFNDMIWLRRMSVKQLFQVRLHIEPEVVRLVMQRATKEDIRELKEQAVRTVEESDRMIRKDMNVQFHCRLGQLCGNPFYSILMDSFMDFVGRFITLINPGTYDVHDDQSHCNISDAIAARDETAAVTLIQSHLLDLREKMVLQEQEYLARSRS